MSLAYLHIHIHTHQTETCSVSPAIVPAGRSMTGWQVVMCDGPNVSTADTGAFAPVHTPQIPHPAPPSKLPS